MKNVVQISRIIKKKMIRVEGNVWCAYLTPTEIIFTRQNWGLFPTASNMVVLLAAHENYKKGLSNPTWYFFAVTDHANQWYKIIS